MWVGSASSADHVRRRRDASRGRCGGAGCGSRTGNGSGAGWPRRWPARANGGRWRSPWRDAPVGGTWSRRSLAAGFEAHLAEPADTRRRGVASGGPRRIAATLACCASCSRTGTARVLDPADDRVGVARTGAAVQDAGRSAHPVGAADPRRVVPARCGGARRLRSATSRPGAGSRAIRLEHKPRQDGSGSRMAYANDRRHLRRVPAAEARAHPLRAAPAGLSSPGRTQYGIGGLIAVAVWSELGDCQRFTRSDQAVRHSGLDVTVDQSDRRRAEGYLSRQGPRSCAGRCTKQPRTPRIRPPRPRLLHGGEGTLTTASWRRSRSPASSPAAAITSCAPSTPTSSTRWPDHSNVAALKRRQGSPTTITGSRGQAPATGVPASHPCWTAFKH